MTLSKISSEIKPSLQELVDEHAFFGMNNRDIESHIRLQHKDTLTDLGVWLIPPPSKFARELRSRINAQDPSAFEQVREIMERRGSLVLSSNAKASPALSHDNQDKEWTPPSKESMQDIANELGNEMGIEGGLTAQVFDTEEESWEKSFSAYLSSIYVGAGPTFLDRYIQGLGRLMIRSSQGSVTPFSTPFEAARHAIKSSQIRVDQKGGTVSQMAISQSVNDVKNEVGFIASALAPWMISNEKTESIQIDSDLLEIFLEAKPLSNAVWKNEICKKPFHIDIQQKKQGERNVSAIFCTPSADGSSFSYMAVVEWIGQGYESFIFRGADSSDFRVMHPGEKLPEDFPPEVYGSIADQIEHIVGMAYMHYKNLIAQGGRLALLDSFTAIATANVRTFSKKDRKRDRLRERTHSYFRVVKITTPADRFGQVGIRRNSWSLDHLVTVSGHFRWQPYGLGLSRLKLIWINAYDKGNIEGGRHRPGSNPTIFDLRNIAGSMSKE